MEMTARGNSTKGEKPCTISDFFYGWMPATTQQRNWRARSDTKAVSCRRHFPLARSRFCCLDSIIPRETMEKAISLFFSALAASHSLSFRRRLRRRCHRFEAASHLLSFHSILSAPCCMGVNSKQQRAHEVPFWSICGNVLIC